MTKVDKSHQLSIKRQCELLDVCRSSFYYIPQENSSYNEELMKLIDKQYTKTPFYGVPRMVQHLRENGHKVNPKRIRRLYRKMDLHAIGPAQIRASLTKEKAMLYIHLLRGVKIERPNRAWGMDITYVPVGNGHMYLVAIIDLYSRFIVGWSLSNTMTAEWCKECLEMAIMQFGAPEILNTDQGSQFRSPVFTKYVDSLEGTKFSMDGKGRAIDNIFIERFWRNIKYEKIYLEPSEDGHELYGKIKWYMKFYNAQRPHQSLDYKRPEKVFRLAA